MTIEFPSQLIRVHPKQILEAAGYHEFSDPNTGKISYVYRLGTGFYPRFHAYINQSDAGKVVIDLHLDQKQASYEGSRMHSGEYDGDTVEKEVDRLLRWCAYYSQQVQ